MAPVNRANNVHIIRLTLKNFGPFRDISVEFPPTGICVIAGPNASGKSQLLGAAVAAIVGPRAVSIDPDGSGPSCVTLALGDGGTEEIASLSIEATSSSIATATARPTVRHISTPISSAMLDAFKGTALPRMLIAEGSRVDHLNKRDLALFERIAPPELVQADFWQDLRGQGWLESGAHSAGVGLVIDFVREFMARSDVEGLPLLVDSFFSQLDTRASEFCAELLRVIGRRSQVIIVTPSYTEVHLGLEVIRLPRQSHAHRAMAYYTPARFQVFRPKSSKKVRQNTFRLGQKFPIPENRCCELKEIKGQNPVGSIGQVVDQYVVAFLNAGVKQTGSIFWGITDDTRTVVGVPLTDRQYDEVRRIVVERVGNIMPPIAPTALVIEMHPVESTNSVPLYVVEVRVPAAQGPYLHATGSEDVYVKTEAGKKKLTIMQIQQELLRRMKGV